MLKTEITYQRQSIFGKGGNYICSLNTSNGCQGIGKTKVDAKADLLNKLYLQSENGNCVKFFPTPCGRYLVGLWYDFGWVYTFINVVTGDQRGFTLFAAKTRSEAEQVAAKAAREYNG